MPQQDFFSSQGVRKRPLSPHLQIYRPQLTSVLSIAHRVTGVLLYVGTLAWMTGVVSLACSSAWFEGIQSFFKTGWGMGVLAGWNFCLFYHAFNGVRHLFWSFGIGFSLRAVYTTGWLVLLASFLATCGLLFYLFGSQEF